MISSKLNFSDLQDPAKLQNFIERFCVLYDENNPNATSSHSSDVPNALLTDDSSSGGGISYNLLSSLQGVKIGV